MSSLDIEQGSDAWRKIRLGKVTASRVADVVARTKSGPSASRANYLAELICERLTGVAVEGFTNSAMQWGTDQEPRARELYEFLKDTEVQQVGFVHHPKIDMAGASPDGLIGGNGLIEIKAPNTATHIETLLTENIPAKYITQMQFQMACCERLFCDYISFDPRLSPEMQIFIKRVERDDALIADMEKEIRAFLSELDDKIRQLTSKFARAA